MSGTIPQVLLWSCASTEQDSAPSLYAQLTSPQVVYASRPSRGRPLGGVVAKAGELRKSGSASDVV